MEKEIEKIEISAVSPTLFDLVKHVSQDGVIIEVSEKDVPLARIVPVKKTHSMESLERALRDCPRLGEDVSIFAEDVLCSRQSLGELDDPWGS